MCIRDRDWTVDEDDLCELTPGTKDNLGITLSIASGSKDAGTYAITVNGPTKTMR